MRLPKVSGENSTILLAEESFKIDRFGLDMITRVEMVPYNLFPSGLRSKHSVHPRFSTMAVSSMNGDKQEHGQFTKITYTYEGWIRDKPDPTYEMKGSTNDESIVTNINFRTVAGYPNSSPPLAIWLDPEDGKPTKNNAKGVFKEFVPDSAKKGMEIYKNAGATWNETSFDSKPPADLGNLGKIDTPKGNPPTQSGRNWLLIDCSFRRRGYVYEITKQWLLSGRNGWDVDIYG